MLIRKIWAWSRSKIRGPLSRPSSIKTNQQHESKSYRFLNLKSFLLFLYRFTTAFDATAPNTRMRRKSILNDISMDLQFSELLCRLPFHFDVVFCSFIEKILVDVPMTIIMPATECWNLREFRRFGDLIFPKWELISLSTLILPRDPKTFWWTQPLDLLPRSRLLFRARAAWPWVFWNDVCPWAGLCCSPRGERLYFFESEQHSLPNPPFVHSFSCRGIWQSLRSLSPFLSV